ncbi:hypothetical protein IMG5_054540 [Ichthyophthirius multifiliis]|uniref:glycine hydroxymethyltransferase n=1 Tax=Ichthyophthirius multifiliis TaxID=5932 RepID=G0QN10_ICHMU|nr:hypothetical protein IMG5_054540 [Ichthyophthirius multifiliis]EGR33389.1 hypothetical protein IMG5_054540 [Ichthyophthirius multifiliis]|eukprot:XP_004037375.1 hypothetical protein IMG5_054540 [Ichthyophthirius multifiliis]
MLKLCQKINRISQISVKYLNTLNKQNLEQSDQEIYQIIKNEEKRQLQGITLIASENHCSQAVLDALGSGMHYKYNEGLVEQKQQMGCQFVNENEQLCQKRALETFRLNPQEWGCTVQSYSGAIANMNVYNGLLQPHDRIMGLDLPDGGHLSHGFQTKQKKISFISQYFESQPYKVNEKTGLIDYDKLEQQAKIYNPKIIVAGASSYSRLIDYERMLKIADDCGAYLLADMAHISGLVAANVIPSPFSFSHIVTTTTHKSLRGPRGSMIFYRKGIRKVDKKGNKIMYDLDEHINKSLYPSLQGGPHNHTISALSVALLQAQTKEFKVYQEQTLKNAKALANAFLKKNYKLVSGGTDNHLVLVDMRSKNTDGARVEIILEYINIYTNKNTVPDDKSALVPSGIRLGTPAMTTRGLLEKDFEQVVEFIDNAVQIIPQIMKKVEPKVADFKNYVKQNHQNIQEIVQLRNQIQKFSQQFEVPGVNF